MKTKLLTVLAFTAILIYTTVSAYDSPSTKPRTARTSLAAVKLKNVQFGFDKRGLSDEYKAELDKVAAMMKTNNASLKIAGHADNIGKYLYNWHLSADRSKTVKEYLTSQGADSSKIAATEFGDTKPIASNKTDAGRAKNRRVEMNFL